MNENKKVVGLNILEDNQLNVTVYDYGDRIPYEALTEYDIVFQWTEDNKLKVIKSRYVIIRCGKNLGGI